MAALKQGYLQRLKRILREGELPYIDIESSCNPNRIDIADFANTMDRLHVGLVAMSGDIVKGTRHQVAYRSAWQLLFDDEFA